MLFRSGVALQKEKDANKLLALFLPVLFESGWDKEVAEVRYNVDRLRYFTDKGLAVIDSVEPARVDGGIVQTEYRFPSGKAQLRLVMLFEKDKGPQEAKGWRLEVLKAGQNKAVAIDLPVIAPAPDGKLVAAQCLLLGDKDKTQLRYHLIVVNDQGAVVVNLLSE